MPTQISTIVIIVAIVLGYHALLEDAEDTTVNYLQQIDYDGLVSGADE